MQLTTTTTAAILLFTSTISAFPIDPTTIYPATNSIYHALTSTIQFDSPGGLISRTPTSNDDLSTIVDFYFYTPTRGKTCEFNFELDDAGTFTGDAQLFDVFTSTKPALESAGKGKEPTSNYRGDYLGRMKAVGGGQATPVEMGRLRFACPEPSSDVPVAFEVAPVGDQVRISWTKTDGPWIRYF